LTLRLVTDYAAVNVVFKREQCAEQGQGGPEMKIAVLGSGDVGQVLGAGFVRFGHEVKMGSRNPRQEKIAAWLNTTGPRASAGTFAEAAAFGELAVLATSWEGTESAIRLADPKNLAGKPVIDATNPLDFSGGVPPKLAIGHTTSAGEQVQRRLPTSKVVKASNTVGNPHMVNPQFPGGPPDMFIWGTTRSNYCGSRGSGSARLDEG